MIKYCLMVAWVWSSIYAQGLRVYHKDSSALGIALDKVDSIQPRNQELGIFRSDSVHSWFATNRIDSIVFQSIADTAPTFGKLVDSRDGQTYKTMMIGNRRWMVQNLNYGKMIKTLDTLRDTVIEKVCLHDSAQNCASYGGLYSWAEAMALPKRCDTMSCLGKAKVDYRGICPAGWRVPTDGDWLDLEEALGMPHASRDSVFVDRGAPLGAKLRSIGNSLGFEASASLAALPNTNYESPNHKEAYYLSSTEYNASTAWLRAIRDFDEFVSNIDSALDFKKIPYSGISRTPISIREDGISLWTNKSTFMSLRCVQSQDLDSASIPAYHFTVQNLSPNFGDYRWRDSAVVYGNDSTQLIAMPKWGYKVKAWWLNGQAISQQNRLVLRAMPEQNQVQLEFEVDSNQGWITDARDGQIYKTLRINGKTWMAQNLNYGTMLNSSYGDYSSTSTKRCQANQVDSCIKYGGLYSQRSAFAGDTSRKEPLRGICPQGWHISTDQEWRDLELYFGMPARDTGRYGSVRGIEMGHKFKDPSTWFYQNWNLAPVSHDALLGLMSGGTYASNRLQGLHWNGRIWTSTFVRVKGIYNFFWYPITRFFSQSNAGVARYYGSGVLFESSVRCVLD